MPYTFGLFLQEAKNDHEHLDCLDYDLFPYDLDTPTGGSVPFGGPIRGGSVHISGDNFLLLKQSTNTLVFNVYTKSVLSLFYDQEGGYRPAVSFKVTNKGPRGTSSSIIEVMKKTKYFPIYYLF